MEFRESAIWYRQRSPQAAADFRMAISDAVLAIRSSPERYPRYLYGTRRCIVGTFPFSVIYLESHDITIVAVAHHKRRPGYWKQRL